MNKEQQEGKIVRPELLKVLCILTFIGSGLSFFSYFVLTFMLDVFRSVDTMELFSMFRSDEEQNMLKTILNLPRIYFIIHVILYAASLLGAYLMWKLNKVGFHIYAVAQISLLIVYEYFVVDAPFPVLPLMITTIFILLYANNLRFMR